MDITGYFIGASFINGYWWFLYYKLLLVIICYITIIDNHYIVGYFKLFFIGY
jgi:hypothetical protein